MVSMVTILRSESNYNLFNNSSFEKEGRVAQYDTILSKFYVYYRLSILERYTISIRYYTIRILSSKSVLSDPPKEE